jgi:hypothetical protein
MKDGLTSAFPAPPIPPSEAIIHISTSEMLLEEARQQGIELAHDLDNLRAGCSCAYRVVSPQRASLLIYTRDYRWYMLMLVGPAGAEVGRETFDVVLEWLRRGQAPKHRRFVTEYAMPLAPFRA